MSSPEDTRIDPETQEPVEGAVQPTSRREARAAQSSAEPDTELATIDDDDAPYAPSIENVEKQIVNAQTEGVFSFLDTAADIQKVRDTVTVYLDEVAIYELNKLNRLDVRDQEPDHDEKVAALNKRIREKTYTFHLVGITHERLEELQDKAEHELPTRYTQIKVPTKSGSELQRRELPNPDRERRFNALRWAEQMEMVVDHLGRTDMAPGIKVAETISSWPNGALIAFRAKIAELEMASLGFQQTADATFPGGGSDLV